MTVTGPDPATIELLKAIAHPLRYAILGCLGQGECNVGEIETKTGIGQPALSQQLSVLRQAGLVATRREARLVFYSVAPAALDALCTSLKFLLMPEGQTARTEPRPGAWQPANLGGAATFARLG
ncbi:metalloregulator ArsR/SmtB family transcription factor [uncultured Novosphingobium sp.]|uniref:ArsR/SmtB family transcription factor n=1 Tax=uncultured Novosphingobium sp. TaxID=292277 RepID=UPI0025965FFB|nr:metalloregulator ArsR/SmtB family transcription factor [uncultured Novosphingobium sp.]